MALPAGITTATVTIGVPVTFTGAAVKTFVSIEPSAYLVHAATGTPLVDFLEEMNISEGVAGQYTLPHTDQAGFIDESGNAYTNWYYTARVTYSTPSKAKNKAPKVKVFQLTTGQVDVDLDLLPAGAPALPYIAPTATVSSFGGRTGPVTLEESDLPGRLAEAALNATYATKSELSTAGIPKWKANTTYAAGDKVLSPNGDMVSALSAFTSGAVYNPINWALSANTAALISSYTAPGGTVITDEGAFKVNDAGRPLTPVMEIVYLGHSWAASDGGITPTRMASLLGVPVYNMGIGGNTSTDIAIRAGGVIPLLTFPGGSIPADTSAVAVTVQPTREYLVAPGGNPFTYTGTVNGIPGTLTYATSTSLWTFARTTAGSLTTVAPNTPFLITSNTYKDRVMVMFPGRNNLYAQSGDMRNVPRDVDAIVGNLTPILKRYVVLADCNASTELVGSSIYNKTIASNLERAARYGRNYYDLRREFIDEGLALAGITPTQADLTAIAGDAPPPSLMNAAGDHPNAAGYTVIGTLISRFIGTKGWGFIYVSPNKLTTNQASIETSTAGWGSNGDGNIVIARSTLQAAHGVASLEVTAGPTASNTLTTSPGLAVTPGLFYAVGIESRAAVTPRARKVEMYWYNSSNGFLSYDAGSSTTDTTTGWTRHVKTGTVAPAGAAFLRVGLASTGAANLEKHYIDKAGLFVVGSAGAAVPAWELP